MKIYDENLTAFSRNYSRKKVPTWKFNWVLNTPLERTASVNDVTVFLLLNLNKYRPNGQVLLNSFKTVINVINRRLSQILLLAVKDSWKSSIVDIRLGSEYASAINYIRGCSCSLFLYLNKFRVNGHPILNSSKIIISTIHILEAMHCSLNTDSVLSNDDVCHVLLTKEGLHKCYLWNSKYTISKY